MRGWMRSQRSPSPADVRVPSPARRASATATPQTPAGQPEPDEAVVAASSGQTPAVDPLAEEAKAAAPKATTEVAGAPEPEPEPAGAATGRAPTDSTRPAAKETDATPIISVAGVTKRFGSHTVLENITFDVPRGAITAILGPSGTGKSVLLKNIIGLLRPEAGRIFVDGEQIVGMRSHDLYRIRRKFGVLFQDGALFGSMNLFDNIAFPLREHTHKGEREIKQLVYMNAEMVGLLDHLHKLPGEVSGGMKKRAGLARAMVMEPEIVLFDEPDSGLDPVRVAYLDDLVVTAQRETGATFFIITHNITSVMRTADYFGVLFRSHLVKFGSKAEMVESKNPIIQQFLAGRAKGPIGMDEMSEDAERQAQAAEEEELARERVA